jgi:hypothetical protein
MADVHKAQPELRSCNANVSTIFWAFYLENHFTIAGGKQSMIFAYTYIIAGVKLGAALANQNISSSNHLTTKTLYAQSLRLRVASVSSTTACLLVSHFPTSLNYAEMLVICTSV